MFYKKIFFLNSHQIHVIHVRLAAKIVSVWKVYIYALRLCRLNWERICTSRSFAISYRRILCRTLGLQSTALEAYSIKQR